MATQLEPQEKRVPMVTDHSEFANLLDTNKFDHMWRIAQMFASSTMVPEHFRKQPANVFIILQMAFRMKVDPFMALQQTCVIHGKPGMESKLAVALLNASGRINGVVKHRFTGTQGKADWACTAYCVEADTGEVIEHRLEWKVVEAEGWLSKAGSKWKTDPVLMMQYRSAHRLCKLHFPEVLMGMYAKEELEDEMTLQGTARPVRSLLAKAQQRIARVPVDHMHDRDEPTPDDDGPDPEQNGQAEDLDELWQELESQLADAETLGDLSRIDQHVLPLFPAEARANAKALVDAKHAKMEGKR